MGSRERWLFPNIVAAVRDKFVVTMQTSRHLCKELVTKYFSLISRRFEYVWLQYSYVSWFVVYCTLWWDARRENLPVSATGNSVPTNIKAESRVIYVSIWVWRGNALYGKNKQGLNNRVGRVGKVQGAPEPRGAPSPGAPRVSCKKLQA